MYLLNACFSRNWKTVPNHLSHHETGAARVSVPLPCGKRDWVGRKYSASARSLRNRHRDQTGLPGTSFVVFPHPSICDTLISKWYIPIAGGMYKMTIIVCQGCNDVIDYVDGEKVEVLYGQCPDCQLPTERQGEVIAQHQGDHHVRFVSA